MSREYDDVVYFSGEVWPLLRVGLLPALLLTQIIFETAKPLCLRLDRLC
jgi:hypothetical protein